MDRGRKALKAQGAESMETDKHYFIEGLFVIGLSIAAAFGFIWLASSGHRDDVLYRIHFSESVSGLAVGDSVKFRGVDVGAVKAMGIDPGDPRLVQVDVKLRKDAPVKIETKAMLKHKGLTGGVFIELEGGRADSKNLIAATPAGQIPEIPSEKSTLNTVLDQLPKVIEKFSSIETQTKKVLSDVGEVTGKIKEDPSLLLRRPKQNTNPQHEQRVQ
jgi:phospholipid/cholesterol/gamma-HCH transport system substrate-binding protein